MKPRFYEAECMARELRLQQNDSLTIKIIDITFNQSIIIDTFQGFSECTGIPIDILTAHDKMSDGYTIKQGNTSIVLYNDSIRSERLNWTLAHEIGHILLNHSADDTISEIEANWFAAELLIPQCVLREISEDYRNCEKTITAGNVQRLFGVSNQAAKYALRRMCTQNQYNHYLEDKLLHKYERQIHDYSRNCVYIY
jgi:Zn-dependent peptidase ImmA (M78 family)